MRWALLLLVFVVSCSNGRQSARDAAIDRSPDRVSASMDQVAADANRTGAPQDAPGADRATLDQAGSEARADSRPTDRPPEEAVCNRYPSTAEECERSTCVQMNCDPYRPSALVAAPTPGPLLAKIRSLRGPCGDYDCPNGCSMLRIAQLYFDVDPPDGGALCDLVAISTDGRSEAFSLAAVKKSNPSAGTGTCCKGGGGGTGYWYVTPATYVAIEPSSVQLKFAADAGADGARDLSEDRDSQTDGGGGDR